MNENPLISVVMPTTCEAVRAERIERAVDSVLSQSGVQLELLFVANGGQEDAGLLGKIAGRAGVRVIRHSEGNVSRARHAGRVEAHGELFCFLDDDDELLPGALATRLALCHQHANADIVVTNGYLSASGSDSPLVQPGRSQEIHQDLGASLLRANWFASPAATFRSAANPPELFDFQRRHFEWTYLFFLLLARGKRIYYDESISYRVYADSPGSASKSAEYAAAYPPFLLELARLPMPDEWRREIRRKYHAALNTQSRTAMDGGALQLAWRLHCRCLLQGGWRYWPYTRHLLRALAG